MKDGENLSLTTTEKAMEMETGTIGESVFTNSIGDESIDRPMTDGCGKGDGNISQGHKRHE
jgi:hypothetical protein